ncbi:MAG: rRNA maturation RNase YbeY [Ignavibacteriae bacterium]|nr:rRNA maturation RNase YbeY [Ignavibacteriota bacterium]
MIKNLTISTNPKVKIDKRKIHELILNLKKEYSFQINSLAINFISEKEIIPINQKYLGHNFSTDIITFNYSGENDSLDGEIFISLDDACFNAKKFNVTLENELIRLVIHGILHLLGFDDKLTKDKKKMKVEENKLVSKFQENTQKLIKKYDC